MLRSCLKHKLGYNMPIQTIGLQVRQQESASQQLCAHGTCFYLETTAPCAGSSWNSSMASTDNVSDVQLKMHARTLDPRLRK